MKINLDKALNHLLNKASSDTRPKEAGGKVIKYPIDADYGIDDIRILSVSVSFEYKTWTVEIAVKKDSETAHQMKRFKLTIPEANVPLWQNVQLDHMARICDYDFNFDFEDTEPASEIADTDNEVVKTNDVIIAEEKPATEATGSYDCADCAESPFGHCMVHKDIHT